jgi:hypothetical protein
MALSDRPTRGNSWYKQFTFGTTGSITVAAIEITSRDSAVRAGPASRALARAATAALAAPSILDTQPWRWRISGTGSSPTEMAGVAELWAERRRQVHSIDPDGRLLALSCGAALHHARVALAADGFGHEIARTPSSDEPDLLATISTATVSAEGYVNRRQAAPDALRMFRAMSTRRTDRRPFTDLPVPEASLDRLRAAAEENGARLVFAATNPSHADSRPTYMRSGVLSAAGDNISDWLAAGEAYSAVLLTATADGLTIHLPDLSRAEATGHPALVVRVGRQATLAGPPATPLRSSALMA